MRFYKQKRFYIPLFILLILLIIATALLYRPIKLIYLAAVDFPVKKEKLEKIMKNIEGSEKSFNEFFKDYIPNTKEFQNFLYFSKTAKTDFIVARFFGLEEYYILSYAESMGINTYQMSFAGFISLGLKHNVSNITKEHIQFLSFVESRSLSYLKNTQELIDYLAENNYFNDDSYKLLGILRTALIGIFSGLLDSDNKFCSLKEKDTLLKQMQQDYLTLQSIRDKRILQEINLRFGDYGTMLKKHNGYIIQIKERINECQ